MKKHLYNTQITWTGNEGNGTTDYKAFSRDHTISIANKQHDIMGSSDPSFRGDPQRYNPEELFLSSLSSCHMLWYLHLCAINKIVVTAYSDKATGVMEETTNGSGAFKEVCLNPIVTISNPVNENLAKELHHKANEMCFIANSCNFTITHSSKVIIA